MRFLPPFYTYLLAVLAVATASCATASPDDPPVERIRRKLDDPGAGVFIAAHRGCHNASPRRQLPAVPENSLPALEHCVLLGVDMMELDVRRSRDGRLVVIHDATVDRTTNGRGKVADLTLAELRRLRLRDNMGGAMSPSASTETLPTLADMLLAARGRIMLNLDVKEDILEAVVAEVSAQGMQRQVLLKTAVDAVGAPEADRPLFAGIPYMPIIAHGTAAGPSAGPARIAAAQLRGSRRPAGVEMVYLTRDETAALAPVVRQAGARLWANTLTSVGVVGVVGAGGDLDALRSGGAAWGALMAMGVDTIQTDEPGPLLDYLDRAGIRH